MKYLKRITAIVLAVVLAFSCLAVAGFAAPTMKSMKIVKYPDRTVFYKGNDWKYGYWKFDPDVEKKGTFVARDGNVCFMHNGGYYSYYSDGGMIDMTGLVIEVTYSDGSKKNFTYTETLKGLVYSQNIYASPQKKLKAGKNTIDVYFNTNPDVYASYDIMLSEAAALRGDVNEDMTVNSADALRILQHVVGMIELSKYHAGIADLTKDGKINSADALEVLLISVGRR